MEKFDFGQEAQSIIVSSLRLLPFVEQVKETGKWSSEDRRGIDCFVKFLGDRNVYAVDITVATDQSVLQYKYHLAGYTGRLVLEVSGKVCEAALEQGRLLKERELAALARQLFAELGPAWVQRMADILA